MNFAHVTDGIFAPCGIFPDLVTFLALSSAPQSFQFTHLFLLNKLSGPPSAALPSSHFSAGPLPPAPAVWAPGGSCRTLSRVVRSTDIAEHFGPETPGELDSRITPTQQNTILFNSHGTMSHAYQVARLCGASMCPNRGAASLPVYLFACVSRFPTVHNTPRPCIHSRLWPSILLTQAVPNSTTVAHSSFLFRP